MSVRLQIIDNNDRGLFAFCELRLYLPLDVQRKCQVRKMTVDNLGPSASGMNFDKYSAQNDVCSFDYSTSVRLIKTETDKAFQFLYCLPSC